MPSEAPTRHKILVVDDEPANLRLLRRVLGVDYEVIEASSGGEALDLLAREPISLIISDQRMPLMTGVQLLKQSLSIAPDAIKILLTGYTDIEALIEAINSGHIYKYIQKPWEADDLKLTVRRAIETYELRVTNERLVRDLRLAFSQLESLSMGTIISLANALDAKCDYTSGHSLRVSRYALAIGLSLGLDQSELRDLELTGILHDIGKIGVPESILWKPARLDDEEREIMAQHPVKSAQMIEGIPQFERVIEWVKYHHEHLDGSGYPEGLKFEQIPLGSRIVLVADAYDAMTSDRPYRQSIGFERATLELRKYAGKQFDGEIVEALLSQVGDNGELLKESGIPASFLGLRFSSIDPLQPGSQYLNESARRAKAGS